MSESFFRFENTKIQIDGKDLMVTSANLSMETSIQTERVYGDYDPETGGAKVDVMSLSPNVGVRGTLEIKFLISAENFTRDGLVNNIDRFLEIKSGMNERPINDNFVGPYRFDNMYLNNFGFQLTPFELVKASARYSIYGSIGDAIPSRLPSVSNSFAHAFKSFNDIKINSSSPFSVFGGAFFAKKIQYQINAKREVQTNIADSERSIFYSSDGVVPKRLAVSEIESQMDIEANKMIPELNDKGDHQNNPVYGDRPLSTITAYLSDMQGNRLASFSCSGKIISQGFNIGENDNAIANISIKEVIK